MSISETQTRGRPGRPRPSTPHSCLTETEARNIVTQLLEVLSYLQEQEIVHRDIKPENIIINPDTLQVKIIDFGFAKFFGHEVQALCGPSGLGCREL